MGISIRNLQRKVKVNAKLLKQVGEGVLRSLGLQGAECGLLFVDDGRIARLNEMYLGDEEPTDVLSFPLLEFRIANFGFRISQSAIRHPPFLLGDVVISAETARRQALKRGRSLDVEMAHLLVHGILHLVGYDHVTPEERRRMRRLARRFLSACFPKG